MIKGFTDRMFKLDGKKILGIKVETETSSERRVPIYPYFEETFKFIEMIEQERERRLYEPSYKDRLKILEKYKHAVKEEEDLDEYEKEERRLGRLIQLNHSPMRITIPEDKFQIILENHKKEDVVAREKTQELMDERDGVEEEIERLTKVKKGLDDDIKTNIKLIQKAKMLKYVLKDHGSSFDIGVTQEERFHGKDASEYIWAEMQLNRMGGRIETYKTIKDEGDEQ